MDNQAMDGGSFGDFEGQQQEPNFPPMNDPMEQDSQLPMGNEGMGGGMENMPQDEGASEIDLIYNQLSDDDKKAAKKYAESLLDRSEAEGSATEAPQEDPTIQTPMMERYVVKKALQNETFFNREKKNKSLNKKKSSPKAGSPFGSPIK